MTFGYSRKSQNVEASRVRAPIRPGEMVFGKVFGGAPLCGSACQTRCMTDTRMRRECCRSWARHLPWLKRTTHIESAGGTGSRHERARDSDYARHTAIYGRHLMAWLRGTGPANRLIKLLLKFKTRWDSDGSCGIPAYTITTLTATPRVKSL
jgi:hypothetical protein